MGFTSPEFAIAFMVAVVVMYDAMGVRRAAGEQAKLLNKMVSLFEMQKYPYIFPEKKKKEDTRVAESKETLQPEQESLQDKALKEYLGHTPLEVLGGALLGIVVVMIMPVL